MIIGIDFGTTNSLGAVFQGGDGRVVANAPGRRLTPSAVSLANDDSLLVGLATRERLSTHRERTATAFERWMSTDRPRWPGRGLTHRIDHRR